MPLSPARLVANRANALQSTGPRSADGKQRSAQNARRHGLRLSDDTLAAEHAAALAHHESVFAAHYRPATPQAHALVRRLALAELRLDFLAATEARLLNEATAAAPSRTLGEAATAVVPLLPALGRTLAAATRAWHAAVTALKALHRERSESPNEPNPAPLTMAASATLPNEPAALTSPASPVLPNEPILSSSSFVTPPTQSWRSTLLCAFLTTLQVYVLNHFARLLFPIPHPSTMHREHTLTG